MSEKWTINAEYEIIQEVGNKQRYRKRRMRKAKNTSEDKDGAANWGELEATSSPYSVCFSFQDILPITSYHFLLTCTLSVSVVNCDFILVIISEDCISACVLIVLSSDSPWSHPSCNPCKDLDTPHLSSHQESPISSVPDTFSVL